MKVNLVSIGASKGVRIPASVIKECGVGNELERRGPRSDADAGYSSRTSGST